MNCKRLLGTALLAGVLTSVIGVMPCLAPQALADEEKPKNAVRPEMGKHLAPAQQAIKEKKFAQALSEIQAADEMNDKTGYEKYIIAALRQQVYIAQGDTPNAARATEAVIASGFLPQAEITKEEGVLAKVYYGAKDYAKAIDFSNRYYRDGGTDDSYRQVIVNSQYLSGDLAGAAKSLRALIQSEERAGQKPSEEQLSNLMGFEYKVAQGGPGYIDALSRLVALYPKKEYWHDLILSVEQAPGMNDQIRLDIDQIKLLTGQFSTASNYMEAAQSAFEAGLPGNAKMFIDKGYADGVLGQGADAAREKRFSDMAAKQANDDQKVLTQEAAAATTGTLLFKLGNAYLSYGQYDQAATAFDKAVKNGSFKTPIEAGLNRIHLGVAYLKQGNKPKAKDALTGVTGPDVVVNVAHLWELYGGLKGPAT